MSINKSLTLLHELDDHLHDMLNIVPRLRRDVITLEDEFAALSEPQFFQDDHTLTEAFTNAVEDAVERDRLIRDDLHEFDLLLADLIKKRGKLAEALGVPVMSRITGGQFSRKTTFTV